MRYEEASRCEPTHVNGGHGEVERRSKRGERWRKVVSHRVAAIMDGGWRWIKEGANKRGNSSRLTQSFHFFMFEPIFSPVNALNQPI